MDVKVGYATSNGTARAGQDYTGTRGTLTIASGDTAGTIPVRVLDDDLGEGDETFIMTLSAAANATISDARGIGTIKDDEFLQVRVSYGSASYTVREAEFVEVSVVLNTLPGRPITIPLTHTGSGGAVETDYSGIPDSVHFDATEMRETFRVLARRDSEQDDGERVILGFGTLPAGVTTASPDSSTVTIQDVRISRRQAPKRWLRRFAETAMVHLLEAIDERIRCAPVHRLVPGRLESQPTRRGCDPRLEEHLSYLVSVRRFPAMQATFDGTALSLPVDGSASARPIDQTFSSLEALEPRSFSAREALARSAFRVSSQVREYGQRISFWGRGALSLFNEDDNGYDLDGDVASAIFGMDYADHRVLAGIALSQSRGDGSYFDQGHDGEAEAILTGLYPYLYLGVNERISVWGAAGLGTGTLNLRFSDLEPGTNIATRMGVIGTRIEILHPEETWGVSLALKADAMLMRITSNETLDLFAARATTSRQRLALELSQEFTFMPGEWVTPFVAIGARRDGGDGETTFATEVGGGFRFESSALGLTTELNARGIIPRAAGDFEEYGVSGSLRYDSITNSTLGPYATLSIVDGFARWAESDSLWGYDVLSNRESNDGEPFGTRINTEFGYGFPVSHGTGVGTPWVGASLSERWRDWRLGYRLRFGPALSLGIDGSLRERFDVDPTPDHSIMLRLSLR